MLACIGRESVLVVLGQYLLVTVNPTLGIVLGKVVRMQTPDPVV
jgi:hypothetical protein